MLHPLNFFLMESLSIEEVKTISHSTNFVGFIKCYLWKKKSILSDQYHIN